MTTILQAMALVERVQREYREHVAEARACGQEPITWREWIDAENAEIARRKNAQAIWQERERNDTLDLF